MGELRQAPSHGPGLEAGCLLSLKAEDRHPGPQLPTFAARPPASSAGLGSGTAGWGPFMPPPPWGCRRTAGRPTCRQRPARARSWIPPSSRKPRRAPATSPHQPGPSAHSPAGPLSLLTPAPAYHQRGTGWAPACHTRGRGQGHEGVRLTQPYDPPRLPRGKSAGLRPRGCARDSQAREEERCFGSGNSGGVGG